MDNFTKWLLSVITGALAAFFGQYGLFIVLVAVAVVLDVVTGLIKAKATGEGLSSEKANKGFWKKISLFVGLLFGIFLDYAAAAVLIHAGVNMKIDMPFALIICAYIILNESISIGENLIAIDPGNMPPWVVKLLRGSKGKIEKEQENKE
ncbi:MAG: phage holin family protein [Acutalibacteraceae bacterium]|nr:phage holin family protein [Acutalibacteraceae bacterium]